MRHIIYSMSESIDEKIADFKRTLAMRIYDEISSKVSAEVMNQVMREITLQVGQSLDQVNRLQIRNT